MIDRMRGSWSLLSVVAAVAVAGCRAPTEITVTVTTDVECGRVTSTAFMSGELGQIEALPPGSTSTTCVGGRLGALVVVPSGDDSANVGFKVVTALDGQNVEECGQGGTYGPKCIVARRGLRFIPHTTLSVPVALNLVCAGNGCGDPTLTCVQGRCVPATLGDSTVCEGAGCPESVLLDGQDGGAPVKDSGAVDATLDGATGLDGSTGSDGATGLDGATADATSDTGLDGAILPIEASVGAPVPGCDLGGVQAGVAWPMEGYCPTRRNRTPFVATTRAAPATHGPFAVDGPINTGPSIGADGTLYVGTDAHTVQAFRADGTPLWRYTADAGALFQSMPVIAADQTIRAFDINSATALYVVLDAKTGAERLRHAGGSSVRGGITLVSGGTTYVPENDTSSLVALSPEGGVLWRGPGSDDRISPAVGPDHTIFVGQSDGTLNAVFPDGGLRWSRNFPPTTTYLPFIAVALDGSVRAWSYEGSSIYSVDIATKALNWTVTYGAGSGEVNGFSLADDGTMYVATQTVGLTTVDGAGNKSTKTFGSRCNPAVIDGAGNLIAWCDGTIASVSSDLSTVHWQVPVPTTSTGLAYVLDTPVVGPDGAVYYALKTDPDDGGASVYGLYAIGP